MPARPILSVAELAYADRAAVRRGETLEGLMQRAGRAVARAVEARFPPQPVRVLCGPGDNGGDGYVAAAELARKGWPVVIEALAPPASPAARAARATWTGTVAAWGDGGGEGLLIDALFGAGLNRPLDSGILRRLEALKARGDFGSWNSLSGSNCVGSG